MIDLTNKVFDRLTVVRRVGSDKSHNATWLCICECGNEIVTAGIYLRSGDKRSCGCLHKEIVQKTMTTHGLSKTRLYKVWAGIKSRCYNPNNDNYKYYGALGITMCDEWRDSFEAFRDWSVANGYDECAGAQACTIDRIDNLLPYSPNNCRWADHMTQCNNQSKNKLFEHNGETHTMAEWARVLGIKYTTLRARIRRGKTFEDAINM